MRGVMLFAFLVLLVIGAACGDDDGGEQGGAVDITAKDFSFGGVNVFVGSGVSNLRVVNEGSVEHNFTIDELEISESLPIGETVVIELPDEPGFYVFYCSFHRDQDMRGTLGIDGGD